MTIVVTSVPDVSIVVTPVPDVSIVVTPQATVTVSAMPAVVVVGGVGGVEAHNVSSSAHQDLRTAIANKASPYTHVQSQMSMAWAIPHNLGHIPITQVFDPDGSEIHGSVINHPPYNASTIVFFVPVSGSARLI